MMQTELSYEEITKVLDYLGISYDGKVSSVGWIKVNCPSGRHPDVHPSCGIHLSSGVANCFSCGFKSNVVKMYQERRGFSTYSEALADIKGFDVLDFFHGKNNNKRIVKEKINTKQHEIQLREQTFPLKPEKFTYTRIRGFTKEFVEQYGIVHCLSGRYSDYFVTPIVDTHKGINLFEARKLMLHETLEKFLGKTDNSTKTLQKEYEEIQDRCFSVKKGRVLYKEEKYKDEFLYRENLIVYLESKKVLYPDNGNISATIWNIDNLDFNEPVYITEGLASMPKVQAAYGNNVSSVFGSNVKSEQLQYLSKFKQVILIPDNDDAGLKLVSNLHTGLEVPVYVIPTTLEDTDEGFVDELKALKPIKTSEFLVKKML